VEGGEEFNAERSGEETQRAQRRRGRREKCSARMECLLIILSGAAGGFGFDFANFVHSGAQTRLKTLVSRFVVCARGKVVWEAGHVGDFVFEIMGVFVALGIADIFMRPVTALRRWSRTGSASVLCTSSRMSP
jgi:hypothetical protein